MLWLMVTKSWWDLLNWPLSSWLSFLGGLLGLVTTIWLVLRLVARVNEDTDPAEADREMLMALNDLHREGDLTLAEFRSIKSELVQRMTTGDGRFATKSDSAKSACNPTTLANPASDISEGVDSESKNKMQHDLS